MDGEEEREEIGRGDNGERGGEERGNREVI